MKFIYCKVLLLTCVLAWAASPASATDRVQAGQWAGTTTIPGRTIPTSNCISKRDADAMNGDAKSVRVYLESIIPASVCKLKDVKVNGGQIIYSTNCQGKENVITTNYHGTSFDGTSSGGAKTEGKLTGACK